MAELVPTITKKNIKNQRFMLEECFTHQSVEKELLYKHTNTFAICVQVTMVTVTSNSGVGVKKMLRENGERFTGSEYFWLPSCRNEMEGREKVYFTTEETTIYPKSPGIYLKSSYYLDEVWLTTYHTSP